jgi:hypothetical protein
MVIWRGEDQTFAGQVPPTLDDGASRPLDFETDGVPAQRRREQTAMNRELTLKRILEGGIVAVVRSETSEPLVKVVETPALGGVTAAEITRGRWLRLSSRTRNNRVSRDWIRPDRMTGRASRGADAFGDVMDTAASTREPVACAL